MKHTTRRRLISTRSTYVISVYLGRGCYRLPLERRGSLLYDEIRTNARTEYNWELTIELRAASSLTCNTRKIRRYPSMVGDYREIVRIDLQQTPPTIEKFGTLRFSLVCIYHQRDNSVFRDWIIWIYCHLLLHIFARE